MTVNKAASLQKVKHPRYVEMRHIIAFICLILCFWITETFHIDINIGTSIVSAAVDIASIKIVLQCAAWNLESYRFSIQTYITDTLKPATGHHSYAERKTDLKEGTTQTLVRAASLPSTLTMTWRMGQPSDRQTTVKWRIQAG
jgi:hypothetical protein